MNPIVKSFAIRTIKARSLLEIGFFDGESPLKSKKITSILIPPEELVSLVCQLIIVFKNQRSLFKNAKLPEVSRFRSLGDLLDSFSK